MLKIDRIDHLVLTVKSIRDTCDWYQRVLHIENEVFGNENRTALVFGQNKINLHQVGKEFVPRAKDARAGSGDFCLITDTPMTDVLAHLQQQDEPVELGPVTKTGAAGELLSVYLRDPDDNLVEVSNYVKSDT